jgi:hypothetical protein
MKLTDAQEQQLAEYPAFECDECKQTLTKLYCGRCDLYYNYGHKADCSRRSSYDQHDRCP